MISAPDEPIPDDGTNSGVDMAGDVDVYPPTGDDDFDYLPSGDDLVHPPTGDDVVHPPISEVDLDVLPTGDYQPPMDLQGRSSQNTVYTSTNKVKLSYKK